MKRPDDSGKRIAIDNAECFDAESLGGLEQFPAPNSHRVGRKNAS
ncbi:hypothetical protein RLEG3_03700 (plasmid) [Rhizobium leguminosarum bv. trifolii WSM1689]|nr:hypothetical protein RLEG3_03700 [Rhizobium leguminosarum bv. trifolii WSM1689]